MDPNAGDRRDGVGGRGLEAPRSLGCATVKSNVIECRGGQRLLALLCSFTDKE
jgi:hypothetical protein